MLTSSIPADMFRLWSLAEQDLLSENITYRLRDTGQGLNRVQAAPKTSRMMQTILQKSQRSVGTWIGSSVIHMGDHNVPNALMFIDKYTQIYRILLPICNTLSQIHKLATVPALKSYIEDEFGSAENLHKEILGDFFRHGFDGSGADNFFDAGSCIDGRLTSAWNWCSSLEKKRYFHVFLLTGRVFAPVLVRLLSTRYRFHGFRWSMVMIPIAGWISSSAFGTAWVCLMDPKYNGGIDYTRASRLNTSLCDGDWYETSLSFCASHDFHDAGQACSPCQHPFF